jgi:hypothetical protein
VRQDRQMRRQGNYIIFNKYEKARICNQEVKAEKNREASIPAITSFYFLYTFSHCNSPFFIMGFFKIRSQDGFEPHPPDL